MTTRVSAIALAVCATFAQALTIDDGAVETVDNDVLSISSAGLYVGDNSTGKLIVLNGGTVSNSGHGYIGNGSGSSGTVEVMGAGSSWTNTGSLYVGNSGTGELTISDGGTVSNNVGYIGRNAGSSGTVEVTGAGSSWTRSSYLYVGYSGTGGLTISDGGTVSSTGSVSYSAAYIGYNSSSSGTVEVTGAGSSWTNSGQLFVGNNGTGKLTISDGGKVTSGNGYSYIANASGSSGTVEVTGAGSSWTSGGLYVGYSGTGKLTISDGGTVSNGIGALGYNSGSSGTVKVTGGGSSWNNAYLYVGYNGEGGLTISDGGTVSSSYGSLAYDAGSSGTVEVTGTGSAWSDTGEFNVGRYGTGKLTISNGGKVSNTYGYIGYDSGASGSVKVTGDGSTWTNSNYLEVGWYGTGELTISDGGKVSSTSGNIGYGAGSSGTVEVTGTGSSWTNTGSLYVGNSGTGELTISDGGTVSNSIGYVGRNSGISGTVVVTGADSAWVNSGQLYVGSGGTGELTISDGGKVSSASYGYIGSGSASLGTVEVTGAGSSWTHNGTLYVGSSGTGELTISDGGTVSNSVGYVGRNAGSSGTVEVTGADSAWVNSVQLYVGNSGTGELTISDGGKVSNTAGYIGFEAGSSGTVKVTGAGSVWTNTSELNVGRTGNGTLTISEGGKVSNTVGYIGYGAPSSSSVEVMGAGSSWSNTGSLYVGYFGEGKLTVSDGGSVSNGDSGYIGDNSGSSGMVEVTGAGSVWTNNGSLVVGRNGTGTLTISDGGTVSDSNNGHIGYEAGSSGTVEVMGAGSSWSNTVFLYVGYNGEGALTISAGGTVSNGNSGYIGYNSGSSGTVEVTGAGSVWTSGSNNGLVIGQDGTGTLTISDGGKVSNNRGYIGRNANSSGTVEVTGAGSSWINSAELYVGYQGTGELTITDNAVVRANGGATIASDAAASGTLDVTSGGILETASLTAGSGAVAVTFDDGTLRALGNSTTFITGFDDGELVIAAGGVTIDDSGYSIATSNAVISGAGMLTKVGNGTLTLTGASTYTGGTTIAQGALTITNENALGSGSVALMSVLNVNPVLAGAFTFNNALTQSGTMNVNMLNTTDVFSFGSGVGSAFTGTVVLGKSTFELAGDNTTALTNATLQVDTGNVTTVGSSNQMIGGLAFNGGTMIFDVTTPGDRVADSTVTTTGRLDARGTGTIQISVGDFANDPPMPNTTVGLLEQDDETTLVQLAISSGATVGSGGALTLVDQTGSVISDAMVLDITQGETKVAEGTYDYRLTTGAAEDGLYVSYGLSVVNLIGTGADALILAPAEGATGAATDLSAKVTGSGDLTVTAGTGNTVSLSNTLNDYTGVTTVSTGTLLSGVDNALGQTSNLQLAADTTFDLNGVNQSIGALNTAAGSVTNLNGGTLTITDTQRATGDTSGGAVYGRLTGSGYLIIDPSIVVIDGANAGLSATTTITGGSEAQLNNVLGLGTGNIELVDADDKLTFVTFNGSTASGSLSNAISGTGTVALTTNETIRLTADNSSFSGVFNIGSSATLIASEAKNLGSAGVVDNGVLQIDTATDWRLQNPVVGDGLFVKSGSGMLVIDNIVHSVTTRVDEGILIIGDGQTSTSPMLRSFAATTTVDAAVTIASGAVISGMGIVNDVVTNYGTIAALNALDAYSTVGASNFTLSSLSNSGSVRLAGSSVGNTLTVSGNYESNGGSLHLNTILGDSSSLTDKLIANAVTTGAGGATSIYVTNVNGLGALTTGDGIQIVHVATSSSSDAFVLGRAVTAGAYEYTLHQGADQSWYLSSYAIPSEDPEGPGQGIQYSPADAAYLGNQTAATTMFMHTLYDRRSHAPDNSAAWARVVTRHGTGESLGGQMQTRTDHDLIHLGVDVGTWQIEAGNLHVGVMGAYGKSKTTATSRLRGTQATGRVDGYSLGVYGTWFADEAEGKGLYVDGWTQYSWFKNKVTGEAQVRAEEKYDSRLWTVSAEAGYGFLVGKTANTEIMLTPQVQIAYNYYDADDHADGNNLKVSNDKASGVVTRVGARLYGRSTSVFTARPYVEANWIYSSAKNELSFDGEVRKDDIPKNRLEAKLGLEGTIAKSWTVWGQAGVQWGKDSYHRYEGQFGLKYRW